MFLIQLSISYRIIGRYIVILDDGMLFLERWRCVGIVLLSEGLDLFSAYVGSSFRPPVMLLAAVDLPLSVAGSDASGVGSYVQLNLQKIWLMCSKHPLLPIMVELIMPFLRSSCSWSLLLLGNVVTESRSGVLSWSRLTMILSEGVYASNTSKMKYRDLVVYFNVILFYIEVLVVKGVLI
jgi:hypothetical protein